MRQTDDAVATVRQLQGITVTIVPRMTHYRHPEHRELFNSGLRSCAASPPQPARARSRPWQRDT
jgi:hypothetical protein